MRATLILTFCAVVGCSGSPAGSSGTSTASTSHLHGSPGEGGHVDGQSTPLALSVGFTHACATRASDGSTWCWGTNDDGQLGIGTMNDSAVPAEVPLAGVVELAAGTVHTCARLATGAVQCWGQNSYGTLGNGNTNSPHTCDVTPGNEGEECLLSPGAVVDLQNVQQISAGSEHTCALLPDATVWCWGDNRDGEVLGYATDNYTPEPVPTKVAGLPASVEVAVGGDTSCALGTDGAVRCWGGQFLPTTPASAAVLQVQGLANVVQVAIGGSSGCARLQDGTLSCWGSNAQGELGDGTTDTRSAPVAVAGVAGAVDVAVGLDFACALLADGSLDCWGDNSQGQLGDGTTQGPECVPMMGFPPSPGADGGIDAGVGEAGPPSPGQCRATAAPVSGVHDAVAVAAGGTGACARLTDGSVVCWGSVGTAPASPTPVPISF